MASANQSNRSKYFIIFLILVILITGLILYFKPKASKDRVSIDKDVSVNASSEVLSKSLNQEESSNSLLDTSTNVASSDTEETVLYDTKSDMSIKPIDPETDPANKIDEIEEKL